MRVWLLVLQAAVRRGMQEHGGQLRAYAAAERLSRALGDISLAYLECLGPTAKALGSKLGITPETCSFFPEEVWAVAHPGYHPLSLFGQPLALTEFKHCLHLRFQSSFDVNPPGSIMSA